MAPSAQRLNALRGAAWPLVVAVILAAALPGTSGSAIRLLGDAAPRALAAGVPVLALIWSWLLLIDRPPPCSRRGRWLGPPLALLAVGSLVWFVDAGVDPSDRLLLLAPLSAAIVLALGGWPLLRRLAGPLALLLLAWPPLHDAVGRISTGPLLAISGGPGAALARWAGADVAPVPGVSGLYACQGPDGPLVAGLDASCSGASGLMALAILAIPVISLRRPAPWCILSWLGVGLALVIGGNIARVALLFWLAATRGCDAVFTQVHLLAGTTLVLVVWGGMLLALPWLGRRNSEAAADPSPAPDPPRGHMPLLACLPCLAGCFLLESAEARSAVDTPDPGMAVIIPIVHARAAADAAPPPLEPLGQAQEPSPPDPPPSKPLQALDLLPAATGWQRWAHASLPWAAGLFGGGTRVERLVYRHGEGRLIWVDVLVCPRAEDLARHTVAGCFESHAYHVERHWIESPLGLETGGWVVRDDGGLRWAVLDWTQPAITLPDDLTHARRCVLWRRVDDGTGDAELNELRALARTLIGTAIRH
jgi:exosortase/archaeosortase family protein